eukprot:6539660-Alexandrium_andersonii.AAC.1
MGSFCATSLTEPESADESKDGGVGSREIANIAGFNLQCSNAQSAQPWGIGAREPSSNRDLIQGGPSDGACGTAEHTPYIVFG